MASKKRKSVVLGTTTNTPLGALSEWGKIIVVSGNEQVKPVQNKK